MPSVYGGTIVYTEVDVVTGYTFCHRWWKVLLRPSNGLHIEGDFVPTFSVRVPDEAILLRAPRLGHGVFITRAGPRLLFPSPGEYQRSIDCWHIQIGMPQTLSTEYDIDPRAYLDRIDPIITEQYPPATARDVEAVIFAGGGPVDYLAWFALDGFEDYTFFYYDDTPDSTMLRKLLGMMPSESEMPTFRAFLQAHYDTCEVVDAATLFEISDTYLPQFTPRPRANIGFFYSPTDDVVAAGINTVPRTKQERILEDVEKLLPSRGVDRFVNDVVEELYDQIEAEIERHVLRADIRSELEADSDFQFETVTTIPEEIHPEFGGNPAELWQQPVSRVSSLNGSQGFLQVWIPQATDELALVTVTAGEYDAETVVARTRDELRETMVDG